MWWLALLVAVSGCDLVWGFDRPTATALAPYRKRVQLVSNRATPLHDFPVAIIVRGDADLQAHTSDDLGRDIAVTDLAGTLLDRELERFDRATGELVLWVRVPELAADVTEVYLTYGGPVVPSRRDTWSAYSAVFHLSGDTADDDSLGGSPLRVEATERTPSSMRGVAGMARGFDGIDDELVAPSSPAVEAGTGNFTYSMWVHAPNPVGESDMAVYKGGSSSGFAGYDVELGWNDWNACLSTSTHPAECASLGANGDVGWHHVAMVLDRDRSIATGYLDGTSSSQFSIEQFGSLDSDTDLRLGGLWAASLFRGELDELRVTHSVLAADWIAVEYANLAKTDDFLLIDAEERVR